jgi:hypothetical protein
MSSSAELFAALQIGTQRATVPESGFVALPAGTATEKCALVEAATQDLMRRAGVLPAANVVPLDLAPKETKPVAKKSAGPLREALAENPKAVKEWAAEAARRDMVAPVSVLPELLSISSKLNLPAGLWGARGRWMASLMDIEIGDDIQFDPVQLRQMLDNEFDNLDYRERASALATLKPDVGAGDLPLLEKAARDSRKEVRDEACELLVLVPQSQLSRSLESLLSDTVSFTKSFLAKKFTVDPPEPDKLPKEVSRTSGRSNFGPKALALFDATRFTRPKFWQNLTGLPPREIIPLGMKTEYADALREGWIEAASRFDDQTWIDELFTLFTESQDILPLIPRVSDSILHSLISGSVKNLTVLNRLVYGLAANRSRTLSPELSETILSAVRRSVGWQVPWQELASILNISSLASLSTPWPAEAEPDELREKLRKAVDLRSRLLNSLETP